MKLLLFAHIPPPHHGQSFMVKMLLEALGGDQRPAKATDRKPAIQCFHVDCRLSDSLDDVGRPRPGKLLLLVKYCLEAIYCRFRYGVTNFLYCPAPGVRAPIYRDWIIMSLCRLFFHWRIYYWHAVGMADWLATQAKPWEQWLTRRLLAKPELSMVLSEAARKDPEALAGARIVVVPNGIADPCTDFEKTLRSERENRSIMRLSGHTRYYELLFLGLCVRDKGLFDAVEAVALSNQILRKQSSNIRVRLHVAGKFVSKGDQEEFETRISRPDLKDDLPGLGNGATPLVQYLGFLHGSEKDRVLRTCDCLCFPSYYVAEGLPVALIEAMAYGLQVVASRWRALPEILPQGHPWLVEPQKPAELAQVLATVALKPHDNRLREHFLANYTYEKWLEGVQAALKTIP